MGSVFGSSGYRPDKDRMKNTGQMLGQTASQGMGGMSMGDVQAAYTKDKSSNPNMVDWGNLSDKDKNKFSQQYNQQSYMDKKPQFSYKPGESGYNMQQQGGTYTPTGFSNFDNKALESSAFEGMRSALQQGQAGMGSTMAGRGLSGGGMSRQAGGELALQAGQGLVDQLRNIRTDAQNQQFAREKAREGQAQFGANFGEQQAGRKLREMMAQQDSDVLGRQEQYGYWKDPYQDQMNLYLGELGAASKDKEGLLSRGLKAGGAALKGIGSL